MIGLRDLEEIVWPSKCSVPNSFKSLFELQKLVLLDVGAAYGLDDRFDRIRELCWRIAVEPDARSDIGDAEEILNVALSDVRGVAELYLTRFPAASSLHRVNESAMRDFANWSLHEEVGRSEVETVSLDELVSEIHYMPDFIKTDTEDHDYHVLNGAVHVIDSGVLGIQAEVSLHARHENGPTFPPIFRELTDKGFQLQLLARESWLRKNLLWGSNSQPQVVWADAVFFLTPQRFLEMLEARDPEMRGNLLGRYVLLLLSYHCHDYAISIIEASQDLVSDSCRENCLEAVKSNVHAPFTNLLMAGLGVLLAVPIYLLGMITWFKRRSSTAFLKRRARYFAHRLLQTVSRAGAYRDAVSDVF